MIALAANKSLMRSKFKEALLANFDLKIVLVTGGLNSDDKILNR